MQPSPPYSWLSMVASENTHRLLVMRLLSWVTVINVLVAAGFAVAGMVSPQSILPPNATVTDAARIFALYAAARTLPLAAVTFAVVYKQMPAALYMLALLAGTIQFVDGFIGVFQHDAGKTMGPFVIAALQFYAVIASRHKKPRPSVPRA